MRRLRATRIAGVPSPWPRSHGGQRDRLLLRDGTGNAAAAVTKLTAPTFTAATPAVGGKVPSPGGR